MTRLFLNTMLRRVTTLSIVDMPPPNAFGSPGSGTARPFWMMKPSIVSRFALTTFTPR